MLQPVKETKTKTTIKLERFITKAPKIVRNR